MTSLVDDRGYNQGFEWNATQEIRMRRRAAAILEALSGEAGGRILELGCGTGELAHFLARDGRARVTGVDVCAPFIEQATRSFGGNGLDFVHADLSQERDVSALGRNFRAVVGNGILHHLYFRIDEALGRLSKLLLPSGQLVFWEPNLFNPYVFAIFSFGPLRKLARLEPDEMAFTPRWIAKRLGTAGFVDIDVRYRDFLVPVLPKVLVPTVSRVGDVVEHVPIVNRLAQSLFITARRPPTT